MDDYSQQKKFLLLALVFFVFTYIVVHLLVRYITSLLP